MLSRFIGIKNNSIKFISSEEIVSDDTSINIIEIPTQYQNLSFEEIITNFRIGTSLKPKRSITNANKLKVAFVGNWKMRCGISTYSENLWPEVAKKVGDFKLFIEENPTPTGPVNIMGNTSIPIDKVVSCWKRGEPLDRLISEIKAYDPDIVWIQHEFGIWSNAGYWLSLMSQLSNYRVIVTMHSVFHHRDKTIVEAAMPEIVVHLEGAKKVLKEEKCLTSEVYVIPHGCYNLDNEKLWNFYKSDHTFMQFGFGFRYKGWELAIKATECLKRKYSDVFFTGLFSESPFCKADHQIYYDELMNLVNEFDLSNNVAIIRGYQSDASLDSYLKTNQAVLFPYVSHASHEVFGASGAARMAMSKMCPVVTTNVNHFSDLPTLKADTPEDIAEALNSMFSNPLAREDQIEKQLKYVVDNSWDNIAARYLAIFEK